MVSNKDVDCRRVNALDNLPDLMTAEHPVERDHEEISAQENLA